MIRTLTSKMGLTGIACVAALGASAVVAPPAAVAKTTAPPATIILTNSSNGKTVLAEKGELVQVRLASKDGVKWSEASVVPKATVSPLVNESGHVNANGSSVTTFKVVGYGTAGLQATGTPKCTGSVCRNYVLRWKATVRVPVQDPTGG
jgi:hypothetical protein